MMKRFNILLIIFMFLFTSCQSIKDGLSGRKNENSDEFLVKKKNPLVTPPNFMELPEPSSKKKNTQNRRFWKVFSASFRARVSLSILAVFGHVFHLMFPFFVARAKAQNAKIDTPSKRKPVFSRYAPAPGSPQGRPQTTPNGTQNKRK